MSTPAPQDLFSRFMAGAFDEKNIVAVSTGFQAFFGRPENGSETIFSPDSNAVDIDIIRGNERISALIPRGTVSRSLGSLQKNLRSEKMSTFSRKYPLSEEEGDITGDILLNRVAGENPYNKMTRMDRLRYHALKIHHENIRKQVRMFEVLAAQSIMTGKQDAIIGTTNADLQYDFRRKSTHTVTVGNAWSGGAATILADIDAGCAKVRANGRTMPDMMILGSTAMNSFVKDATVAALADNRRFEFMAIGRNNVLPAKFQRFVDGGFIPQGSLRTPAGFELYLFTYLEIYNEPAAGVATKYLADDKVILAASSARCDRYFGPPENLPMVPMREALYRDYFGFDPNAAPMPGKMRAASNVIDSSMFYADAYVSGDWKKITVRSQTAPIFATTQTDAFVTIDTEP
jgi:hypothetical protein